MLQTPEVAAERIQKWLKQHPAIAETDANIACLTKYIANHFSVAGETIIDYAYLDLAYQTIGGTLQHIVGPEQQIAQAQQVAQAQQRAAQLAEEKEKLKQEIATNQRLKDSINRLDTQNLRSSAGFATATDIENENARIQGLQEERRKSITRMQRHEQFAAELRAANDYMATNANGVLWGKTNDTRNQMKEALKRKFPEFSGEVN